MELIELIIDVLEHSNKPLQKKEIDIKVFEHPNILLCNEIKRVEVKGSAIARCLTKFSTGTNPIIGVFEEGKASFKKYYLNNKNYSINILREIDLHPILAKFVFERFGVYSKTIQANKMIKRTEKSMVWTNPDMVGVNPILLNWNSFFQKESEKLGLFSNKVLEFYSFELKLKIDKSNITECYFQAVSNSSWANHNYLVVGELDRNTSFLEELKRLNKGYGIGIIKLNTTNPIESEIVIEAREKEVVDINFLNFLSSYNSDFMDFMNECLFIVTNKTINNIFFDEI